MQPRSKLNECATSSPLPGPLWRIDPERTLFVGPLSYNAPHQHGAPVFLAGIYGPFGLRSGATWHSCRTAIVPAGLPHELHVGHSPIGVFYIEPTLSGVGTFRCLMHDTREVDGVLLGARGDLTVMRQLWEDPSSAGWTNLALDDLMSFCRPAAADSADPRVGEAMKALFCRPHAVTSATDLAARVGLSSSRFQHLFTRGVGVPFRRYRAWIRMRRAISEIVDGSNFTSAAHAAGFADQAHFNNDFRRTFGAPPSVSLRGLRT